MDKFIKIPFPEYKNIVYIIGIDVGEKFYPFYIGESSRSIGRFSDYISANFSASTDFKVGEAVKFFKEQNYIVSIKFQKSDDRKREEIELTKNYRNKYFLLNDLVGYDYEKADVQIEKDRILNYTKTFIDDLKKMMI